MAYKKYVQVELKPCPFCGGEADLCQIYGENLWLVKCWNTKKCKILPRTPEVHSMEEAMFIWNTRLG